MGMGCLVTAFVEVSPEVVRKVIRVQANRLVRNHKADTPVQMLIGNVYGRGNSAKADDSAHGLRKKDAAFPALAPANQKMSGGVYLNIIIYVRARVLKENLAAAVFPDTATVFQTADSDSKAAHAPLHPDGSRRTGNLPRADWGVGEVGRPVYVTYIEKRPLKLEGARVA